jgi:hypothetical protein
MDTLNLILAIAALLGFVGLAFVGGWELGQSQAKAAHPRRPTVSELIEALNSLKPEQLNNRRKAARKAVRA